MAHTRNTYTFHGIASDYAALHHICPSHGTCDGQDWHYDSCFGDDDLFLSHDICHDHVYPCFYYDFSFELMERLAELATVIEVRRLFRARLPSSSRNMTSSSLQGRGKGTAVEQLTDREMPRFPMARR
ncbi:hypothetical protein LWI28_000631 [Acer negundo]|uniref:Uncharacterized protein n=1 Tax=Acer negundo TaxID=4023 RepID=A0AAD5JS15_ACENE|nr:hypothetical protein LWI28_000631 [Acer negundo]